MLIMNRYDAEQIRNGFNQIIRNNPDLTVSGWSKRAQKSEGTLRAFLDGTTRSMKYETLKSYADALGITVESILGQENTPTISLVGYIGAGYEVYPFDDHEKGAGLDEVECPPGVDPNTMVALKVRGDSMYPAYDDGDIIYYGRSEDFSEKCLGRESVVKLVDGRMFLKILQRSAEKERFTLHSHNQKPIENVEVEWCAPVAWIKRA